MQRDVLGGNSDRPRTRTKGWPSSPPERWRVRREIYRGYLLSDEAVEPGSEAAGTLAAAVLGERAPGSGQAGAWEMEPGPSQHVARLRRYRGPWPGTFGAQDGVPAPTSGSAIAGMLGGKQDNARASRRKPWAVFLLGWHFPNRHAWAWWPTGTGLRRRDRRRWATFTPKGFADAWDVVR